MCLPGSMFCTQFQPILLLLGLSNLVGFCFTKHSTIESVKMGFALPVFLFIEMTSPVISVKNATTEYSGTYSCTVTNRVGSDQCLLRLDVVPGKYLFSVMITFVSLYTALFGSFSKSVWRASGC